MKKKLLSILITLCMVLTLFSASTLSAAAATPTAASVNLYQMYVGGYMNMIVYAEKYPINIDGARSLENVTFEFADGDDYDLVLVDTFKSKDAAYYDHFNVASFHNPIKGDKNGNIIVFNSDSPLYGLIVRADTGYLFISGFPKTITANNALGTPKISVAITHDKTSDAPEDYVFTFKFYDAGRNIAEWPQTSGTVHPYVVSHGYATIPNSNPERQYALAASSSASQALTSANLSTWYPGNKGTLIFPFMLTNSTAAYNYRLFEISADSDTSGKGTYYSETSGGNTGVAVKVNGSTLVYPSSFPQVSTPAITFPMACAMLSDGGYLNLTMSVGSTYNIYEALCGSFGHLRNTGSNICVTASPTSFVGLIDLDSEIVEVNGTEITALKNGEVETANVISFTRGTNNCTYWRYDNSSVFSSFIRIKVVGGLVFDTNEDGKGGTTEANSVGKYYVEKLVYDEDGDQWVWETQALTTNTGDNSKVHLSLSENAPTGTLLKILSDADGAYYTVSEDDVNVGITNLDLGTGYRIKYVPNEPSAATEYSAFFTPPASVDVTAEINSGGTPGSKGKVTVTQEYGAYGEDYDSDDNGASEVYQEYMLQVWDDTNKKWGDASDWYWAGSSATDKADNTISPNVHVTSDNSAGTVVFTNLDETAGVYRVITRLVAGGETITDFDGAAQKIYSSTNMQTIYATEGDTEGDIINQIPFAGPQITIPVRLDNKTSPIANSLSVVTLVPDDNETPDTANAVANGSYLAEGKYYIYENDIDTGYYVVISQTGTTPTTGVPIYSTTYYDPNDNDSSTVPISYEYFTVTVSDGGSIDTNEDFGIWDGNNYVDKLIVLKGTEIQLAATPDGDATQVTWKNAGGGTINVGSDGKLIVSGTLHLTATGTTANNNSSSNSNNSNDGSSPITVSNNGGGTITGLTGTDTIKSGEKKVITIKPNEGKKTLDVVVNGDSAKGEMIGDTLTVTGDGENKKIDVIFTDAGNAIVNATPTAGGSMTLTGDTADKSPTGLITAHEPGTTVTLSFTADDGYFLRNVIINGISYGAQELLEIEITEDMTIVPLFSAQVDLNDIDHFAYIIGYDGGAIRPMGNITREEVATIFFRLLTEESRTLYMSTNNDFEDVLSTRWSNTAISTLAGAGIIGGRTQVSFDPGAHMTRAEFATIASRFSEVAAGSSDFTDITNHWAETDIINAYLNGWVNGYNDGTFRPNGYITRAEVMTLANRILNRAPADADSLLDGMSTWSDNTDTNKWYYIDVQEASNAHYYDHLDGSKYWTSLRENFDWSVFERINPI